MLDDDDYNTNKYKNYRSSLSLYTEADLKHMERFPLSTEDNEYYYTHRGADEKAENKPEFKFSDSFIKDIKGLIIELGGDPDKRPGERD